MPSESAANLATSLDESPALAGLTSRALESSPISETLADMPSWMSRSVLYVSIVFVVVGLAFAWFGRIDVVVSAPAAVMPSGRLKPVQSELEGIVMQILVEEGDKVEARQPLAVIDSREVVTILAELRTAEQTLADVDRTLNEVIPLKRCQNETRIKILRKKIASHAQRQDALGAQVASENAALALARQHDALERQKQEKHRARLELQRENDDATRGLLARELQAIRQLRDREVVTDFQLRDSQRKLGEAQVEVAKSDSLIDETEDEERIREVSLRTKINAHEKALAALQEEVAENAAAVATAELEIRQMEDELELMQLETRQKRDTLAFKLRQARQTADLNLSGISAELLDRIASGEEAETDRHRVLAPVGGRVGRIAVTDGATAQRGMTLLTLVPQGVELLAEVRVRNRDVGRIREGLTVRLKFDAFPYAEHGAITGRLTRLVRVAEAADRAGQAGRDSYYRGYCSLDQAYFRVRGERKPLLPGMTATAEIVTQRKRIIEILLRPLLEFQQGRKAES